MDPATVHRSCLLVDGGQVGTSIIRIHHGEWTQVVRTTVYPAIHVHDTL